MKQVSSKLHRIFPENKEHYQIYVTPIEQLSIQFVGKDKAIFYTIATYFHSQCLPILRMNSGLHNTISDATDYKHLYGYGGEI